jgi:tetratricopeptide (TPR) repeat protein
LPQIATSNHASRRPNFFFPLILFLLAAAVFANSVGHDFVWDDNRAIRDNLFLVSPGAWWRCFGRDFGLELTGVPVGYYRPLVFLSFILNHIVGALRPFTYHLTNVLLHGLNTVLVFGLVARLADRKTGALAAALFAVHPVHAESVAFIAGRSDLLCACFLLLSVRAMIRSFSSRRRARMVWSIAAAMIYICALLSKEMAVALPGVLIVYGLLHRYRRRTLVRLCGPSMALALLYLAFRFCFFPMAGIARVGAFSAADLAEHLARLLFLYAAQQAFPVTPTLGAEILTRRVWVDVAAVVLLVLLVAAAKPRRRAADSLAWMAGFLAPVLWVNLFTHVDLNDRFAYVPSIGVCALAAMGGVRYWDRYRLSRLVVAVVLVAFAALSFCYSRMWRDSVALWNASIAYHPTCGRCYFNLGNVYWLEQKKPTEAVRMLHDATKFLPDDGRRSWAYANMAQILAQAEQNSLAIESARRSLELRPRQIGFRRWFASLLSDLGRHDEAIAELEKAQEFAPQNGDVWLDLAYVYLAMQPPQTDRARRLYQRGLELGAEPDEEIEAAIKSGG